MKKQQKILTFFVRSFGSLQGTGLRPSEVVRVVRRAMDDWPATPQGSKRTSKTGNHVISEHKKMKNEANFNSIKLTVTSCSRGGYNDFAPKTQNGANPNKANLKPISARSFFRESLGLQKNLFMGSKPNFKNQENTASTCKRETYPNLHPQTNRKSKPNPNPIKAKPNPIKANFSAELISDTRLRQGPRTIKFAILNLMSCRKFDEEIASTMLIFGTIKGKKTTITTNSLGKRKL
ncbi:MAG TPA: hypothetical protein ENH94_04620 [Phycisphaerales bacterium]|nr:hypothetical protein [Phycisphaerales bacterium]